ncbi:hypothetical protein A0H76_2141 [Hepatospora eriocheir]|uniref:Uncharacterized protein n=1 Tax=Hepatospora eriocheir TaxID=1081669 RepID=A0A1X0QFS5_9MICR|nr:hypothetical protein A0H76_2141 [Hepatospora eriocheir]
MKYVNLKLIIDYYRVRNYYFISFKKDILFVISKMYYVITLYNYKKLLLKKSKKIIYIMKGLKDLNNIITFLILTLDCKPYMVY